MTYNLTEKHKELIKWIVEQIRAGDLDGEFIVGWVQTFGGKPLADGHIISYHGKHPPVTQGALDALAADSMIMCTPTYETTEASRAVGSSFGHLSRTTQTEVSRVCTVTKRAFEAVDADFSESDVSFFEYLTPLDQLEHLDEELKARCLPGLGAGGSNPVLWDSAIRTASVVLEARLREISGIDDPDAAAERIVNYAFGQSGAFSGKLESDRQMVAYRNLYSGVIGTIRNRYVHRLVDPRPEDAGVVLLFINLLLKMLEDFR